MSGSNILIYYISMGCTHTKLFRQKIEDVSLEENLKIQTVLELDDFKTEDKKYKSKSSYSKKRTKSKLADEIISRKFENSEISSKKSGYHKTNSRKLGHNESFRKSEDLETSFKKSGIHRTNSRKSKNRETSSRKSETGSRKSSNPQSSSKKSVNPETSSRKSVNTEASFKKIESQIRRAEKHYQRTSKLHNDENNKKLHSDERIKAKYVIKNVIGKGTCSRVFRVEHKINKHPYALKIIDTGGKKDVFEAELSILRRVNHTNIVKLVEVLETNSKVYMIMELATGGSLLDRLETKGILSEKTATLVMTMVLNGVKYLHSLGITHRDLKPDNLLYYHPGSDSRIMISDFGLASTRKHNGDVYMRTICGTPQYLAPEIILKKPYTNAVDLWSLGVITYIILCGEFPFHGNQDIQIFKEIIKGSVNMNNLIWKNVSREARLFILQLLQIDPLIRLNAEQALIHDWLTTPLPKLHYSSTSSQNSSPRSEQSVGSTKSIRSGQHRIQVHQLEALSTDPDVVALLSSSSPFSSSESNVIPQD